MASKTDIQWTEATWNPVRGCTKVSAGCKNCYAETFAERWRGIPGHPYEQGFDLRLVHEALELPLKWKKPRRIFVNSMSDLFHMDVPFKFIHEVWGIMRQTPQHTYQILTKRADRMLEVVSQIRRMEAMGYANGFYSHVHLGVSVENQPAANERIPLLLQTPAAVRFISAEPLLGPVNLQPAVTLACPNKRLGGCVHHAQSGHRVTQDSESGGIWVECACSRLGGIHWVIAGGESGHGARPMHPDWARSLRDQCQAAGVPFFFKQWGEWAPIETPAVSQIPMGYFEAKDKGRIHNWDGEGFISRNCSVKIGKKAAGRLLDGREWNQFPGSTPITKEGGEA